MLKRLCTTLILGFVLGTIGLLIFPDLGRLAGPILCAGTLEPSAPGLHYRCIQAADGLVRPVPAEQVLLYTVPALSMLLLLPVSEQCDLHVGLLLAKVSAAR